MPHWLTRGGWTAAALVGIAVWAGAGPRGLALLLLFFIASSALTRGGGPRRATQVIANGGVAALGALLARGRVIGLSAFAGSLAAAAADTWSTEIGGRSPVPPRLITTWRRVPAGSDGGVTPLGTAGGVLGAAVIAVGAALLGLVPWAASTRVAAAGVAGTLLDSLLGATLQRRSWLNNDAVNLLCTVAGAAVAAWLA